MAATRYRITADEIAKVLRRQGDTGLTSNQLATILRRKRESIVNVLKRHEATADQPDGIFCRANLDTTRDPSHQRNIRWRLVGKEGD